MIGKDKCQLLLTLSKADKAKLQTIAQRENRTVTSIINSLIKIYLLDRG